MGAYLSEPIVEKESVDERGKYVNCGASSMQGWRVTQEDAHNCILDFEPETGFFAVYDGHGGSEVATYAAAHLPQFLKECDSFKKGDLELGLKEAFLGFDAKLATPEVVTVLKEIAGKKDEDSEDDEENVRSLFEEAEMPLEQVMAKYAEHGPLAKLHESARAAGLSSPLLASKQGGAASAAQCSESRVIEFATGSSQVAECPAAASNKVGCNGSSDVKAADTAGSEADKDSSEAKANKSEAESATKAVSSPTKEAVSPTKEAVSPTKEAVSPTKEAVSPTKEAVSPTKEAVSPTKEAVSPTKEAVSPSKEAVSPKKEALSPTKEALSPTKEAVSPKKEAVSPTKEAVSPTKEAVSPKKEAVSPKKEAVSPTKEAVSPKKEALSPTKEALSPTKEAVSPIKKALSNGEVGANGKLVNEEEKSVTGETEGCNGLPYIGKGKGKARLPTGAEKAAQARHAMALRRATASALYKSLLEAQGDSDSDSESDADETFEGPPQASSDDDDDDDGEAGDAAEGADGAAGVEEEEDEDEEDDEESADDEEDDDEDDDNFSMKMTEEAGYDSGCTAVVALLRGAELFVANAGDSRCVVCRAGQAVEMSQDHKPEDQPELDRIVKAGGKVTEDGRVNGGLNLSRALGDHAYKLNAELPAPEQMITALPDVRRLTLEPGRDEFMVLACDGIWNFMSSQEVVDFVRPRVAADADKLSTICEELFDHCLAPDTMGDGTGCDNMTCVIVKFLPTLGLGSGIKRPASPEASAECVKRAKTDGAAPDTATSEVAAPDSAAPKPTPPKPCQLENRL